MKSKEIFQELQENKVWRRLKLQEIRKLKIVSDHTQDAITRERTWKEVCSGFEGQM